MRTTTQGVLISCATPTGIDVSLFAGGENGRLSRMAKHGPGDPGHDEPGLPGRNPGGPGRDDLVTLNRSATVARVVAGVFHELNNSLQVIGGLAELLQDAPGTPPSVADG